MKKWWMPVLAVALAAACWSEEAPEPKEPPRPAAPPAQPSADKMKRAHELLEQAQKEADAAKKQGLMQEHGRLMREIASQTAPAPSKAKSLKPEQMAAARQLLRRIQTEKDADKREELVKENAALLAEHLAADLPPMEAPAAAAAAPAPAAAGGDVEKRLERIEKKLEELAELLEKAAKK